MLHAIRRLVFAATLLFPAALPCEARSPQGRPLAGTVQHVDPKACRATVLHGDGADAFSFVWNRHTVFHSGAEILAANRLKPGVQVKVTLHSPLFGDPYATKVTFLHSFTKAVATSNSP